MGFVQQKSQHSMKSPKMVGLVFTLTVSLLGPPRVLAQPQEEQPSAETPAQTVEVEINPLASVLTIMNIPARAVLCGLTGWMASIVMTFSGGMRYADAAKMMEDGCSGPWIITPEMLEKSREKEKSEAGSNIPGGEMVLRREGTLPSMPSP